MMQSSDPAHEGVTKGHDFGLDAFHIHVEEGKTRPGRKVPSAAR